MWKRVKLLVRKNVVILLPVLGSTHLFCTIAGRLQYFARGVASYIKQLKTDLQGKKPDAVKSDEVCHKPWWILVQKFTKF